MTLKYRYILIVAMAALCVAGMDSYKGKEGEREIADVQEWQAKWIGAPWEGDEYVVEAEHPTPEFRKAFRLDSGVKSAVAYVTGLGMFELYMNGERVGNDYYSPNETTYGIRPDWDKSKLNVDESKFRNYRVMYLAYDVTRLLRKGENCIGAIVGNGWYSAYRKNWITAFGTPRFICQIEITFKDGSTSTLCTDESWQVRRSPILWNDIYRGEVYDARMESSDDWLQVVKRSAPLGKLERQKGLEDRIMEVLEPESITKLEDGSWEVDFGDYITGRVHLSGIRAQAGTQIVLEHPLPDEENLNNWVKRSWNGDYVYICKGDGPESYAPRFSWYSFRKVIVKDWPGELKPSNIKAEAIYTNIRTNSKFDCSNPLLLRINRLFWRAQTDNMHMGVATDCPHREKGPYTGDGQVACVAVMHNFDADAFYRKWLRDMSDCQNVETGYVPNGAPWHPGCGGGVAWGAAMCIIPWEHYVHYGDLSVLEEHYEAMKGHLAFMEGWRTEEGIMNMQLTSKDGKPVYYLNLGEWCPAYGFPDDRLVHTFFLWKCARYVANAAGVLGKPDEAAEYEALAESVKEAFHNTFYDPETRSYGHNDGSNVFALYMGVPDDRKADVVESLRSEILENGGHLNTGIFGTQIFFEVLCDNGLAELAYEALCKKDQPGFGWWVEQGADTMWEYWDGKKSRNHPMFGGGITWFYTHIAGLKADPAEPGYRHMIVKPTPMGDLTYASYETQTPQGRAAVRWTLKKGRFVLKVTVPDGSHASIWLPGADEPISKGPGKHTLQSTI